MKGQAEQLISESMPSQYCICKLELYLEKEELVLFAKDDDSCNAVWTQLYGQLTYRTEGYIPFEYLMPGRVPENNIILLESTVENLLMAIEHLEQVPPKSYLPSGTYEKISEQVKLNESHDQPGGKI